MQVQYYSNNFKILRLQNGDSNKISGFSSVGLTEKGHERIFSGGKNSLYLD